jgi:hypothetical protein
MLHHRHKNTTTFACGLRQKGFLIGPENYRLFHKNMLASAQSLEAELRMDVMGNTQRNGSNIRVS